MNEALETLLIVDDSDEIRQQLKWGLFKDYSLLLAGDRREALALFRKHRPKVVTLDLGLPPQENTPFEGFSCLQEMMRIHPHAKVIVITGQDDKESAVHAVQSGAYDFYHKPIDLQELRVIIRRALHLFAIEEENRALQASKVPGNAFCGMVGDCPEMAEVFLTIRKVAPSDASVLITGESGTGKELVARSIHSLSMRKDGPFIPINCSAIPETLLEAELFGHEKGAFTGASVAKQGKVEYAHAGTLFLDEIGEMPAPLQVKLLRFLQDRTIQRVGGRQDIAVDTRVIAATNRDILREIQAGHFREDLYYRLGVITICLPNLRDRGDDVQLLANLFVHKYASALNKRIRGFSPAATEAIRSHNWPGNVRELENRIQRAVIMTESKIIESWDLGFEDREEESKITCPGGRTLKETKNIVEREMILSAFSRHGGNVSRAADELGVSRPTLYDLLKKHGIPVVPPES